MTCPCWKRMFMIVPCGLLWILWKPSRYYVDTSKYDGHVGKLMTWLAAVTPDCKKRWNPWQIIDIFSVCSDQCSGNAVRPSLGLRSFNQLLQTILSTNIFWSLSAKVGWPIYQLWMATQNVCKIGNQWHFWSQSPLTPLFCHFFCWSISK